MSLVYHKFVVNELQEGFILNNSSIRVILHPQIMGVT